MIRFALVVLSFFSFSSAVHAQCPPAGYDRATLDALKQDEWAIADAQHRNAFARALVPCLESSDAALRDGIAFEALSHLMRAQQLSNETMTSISETLLARLAAPDPDGVGHPFAILVLSEAIRADRVAPYMTAALRQQILDTGVAYLTNLRDYRGFDEHEGWRHGVAHSADLMLQLSVNPATSKDDLVRIRDAVTSQVAPDGHFYIYGESERLAHVIIFMARRGLFAEEEWTRYFARFPAAGEDPFASEAGLAWRHNTMAFLSAIYFNAALGESNDDDALIPGVATALRAMP